VGTQPEKEKIRNKGRKKKAKEALFARKKGKISKNGVLLGKGRKKRGKRKLGGKKRQTVGGDGSRIV